MNDPLVLILFLATWGGIVLLFRRLADDFRKATVRQSEKPAQIDEELLRITGEVQETIEGLSEAMGKRAEQLRSLLAEADTKIESLQAALRTPPIGDAALPKPLTGARVSTLRVDEGLRPFEPHRPEAPEESARGSGGAQRPPATEEPTPTGRGSTAQVLRLAAEGHDIDTIARLTNRGREEVRLLLGTRH